MPVTGFTERTERSIEIRSAAHRIRGQSCYRAPITSGGAANVFVQISADYRIFDLFYLHDRVAVHFDESAPGPDFEGNPRSFPEGSNCDMGVFEHVADSPTDIEKSVAAVAEFRLEQNYPNPFNAETVISYRLPVKCKVDVGIDNIAGHKVAVLLSGERPEGIHRVVWDGRGFSSGMYLCKFTTDDGFVDSKKLLLLK
jgi:hypothetical protein